MIRKEEKRKKMMKKVIILVSASVMFLTLIGPVFAYRNIAVIKNNDVSVIANTGENIQGNSVSVKKAMLNGIKISFNNTIITGDAKAKAKLYIRANDNWDYEENNFAVVKKNGVNVYADTGVNGQFNDVTAKKAMMDNIRISGNNIVTTGNAKAKAKTWMVVNSSWLY